MERRSDHRPGALSGYRILDLCAASGVLCTKILADLGADVIKVEAPAGNATRYRGPFYQEQTDPEKSLFFWYFHTNKRSVTWTLRHPLVRRSCTDSWRLPMPSWKPFRPAISMAWGSVSGICAPAILISS